MLDRESLAIQQWLEEKAPTPSEEMKFRLERLVENLGEEANQPRVFLGIDPGNPTGFALYEGEMDVVRSHPSPPAPRRDLERLKVVDVEPDWDVASMIDAHRNGCTALDEVREDVVIQKESGPLFQEVAMYMWDPRHEMGPRQRDWYRRQRNQPRNESRKQRKGKSR